jgi:hypothetical protein
VRGVLAWERSCVGDPADDFAALVALAPPETLDSVLEAYAQSRVERPDVNLVHRARLAAEMAPLTTLLHALASGLLPLVERTADELRVLDARVEDDDRRHAQEDASRSERTRRAKERALLAASIDPDDPEQPLPGWDATQPHSPFPMLGETQYIEMSAWLTDDDPSTPAVAEDLPEWSERSDDADPSTADAVPDDESRADEIRAPGGSSRPRLGVVRETGAPVPYVSPSDRDGAAFEIDEVEALPDDVDGVLDLHEGASDFVRITERRQGDHAS